VSLENQGVFQLLKEVVLCVSCNYFATFVSYDFVVPYNFTCYNNCSSININSTV
jgi:hypothetical protein